MKKQIEKVQLIDKANDVSAFASTDPTRPVVNGVYANGKGTEATNGRIAIRVPYKEIDPAEFPAVENATVERVPVIMPLKPFQEALRSVPKSSSLPVLGCVRLSTVTREHKLPDGKTDVQVKAQFATTDLETDRVIESKVIDGKFPDIDQVMPAADPTLTIGIGSEYLKLLADYAVKHGKNGGYHQGPAIAFSFTDELSAVKFTIRLEDGRVAEGALMPVRLS